MVNRNLEVYHGFAREDDRMIKLELNRNTRLNLLSKYRVKIITTTWEGDMDKYDIIIKESIKTELGKKYIVVKNNSSCGGKHLMLLCDGINLLSFGGNSEGNILHIYGGGE